MCCVFKEITKHITSRYVGRSHAIYLSSDSCANNTIHIWFSPCSVNAHVHDSYECLLLLLLFFRWFLSKWWCVTESVKIATLMRSLFRACCFSLSEDRKAIAVLRFSLSAEPKKKQFISSSHGTESTKSILSTARKEKFQTFYAEFIEYFTGDPSLFNRESTKNHSLFLVKQLQFR